MTEEKDTSSATWKFQFEDTVNADPLAKGACLKVLRVYLNFASKSDPRAYCSLSDLTLRTGCTRPTVKKAIKVLIRLGYLVPLYITDGGAMMYKLVNARKDLIDDHLRIAEVSLAAERADRKKRERKAQGVKKTYPPKRDENERNFPPVEKETFPNTVELIRRDSSSEGRGGLEKGYSPSNDNPYGLIDDDPSIPFEVPQSDHEADEILSNFGHVNPVIRSALRRMLMAGELTPALISANLGGANG